MIKTSAFFFALPFPWQLRSVTNAVLTESIIDFVTSIKSEHPCNDVAERNRNRKS